MKEMGQIILKSFMGDIIYVSNQSGKKSVTVCSLNKAF